MSTLNQNLCSAQTPSAPLLLKKAHADACGKVIVVGEHAVVYGAKALAMPFSAMRIEMTLEPLGKNGPPKLYLGQKEAPDHVNEMIFDACAALGIIPKGFELRAQSNVLIGAGLGSSASLSVAMLRVLAKAYGISLSQESLSRLANHLERRFHGSPSGLDTAVVACESVISFIKGRSPQSVCVKRLANGKKPWSFALIDTGVRSPTLAMIQTAAPYFTGDLAASHLKDFDHIADLALKGLSLGQLEPLAEAMNKASEHLDKAGVINQELHQAILAAQEAGALAAKPTGAGGGGCALALLDPDHADEQMLSLQEHLGKDRIHGVTLG